MALFGLIGGLAIAAIVAMWATVKILGLAVSAGEGSILAYIGHIWRGYFVLVAVVVGLEIWPGLSNWAHSAFDAITTLL